MEKERDVVRKKSLSAFARFLKSDEGRRHMDEYFSEQKRLEEIHDSQIERFHKGYAHRIDEIIERLIAKYSSKENWQRWYSRGIEPPNVLYWFILDYAKRFGREATGREWKKYGNTFTSSLFKIGSYFIQRMDGQGCVVRIDKES